MASKFAENYDILRKQQKTTFFGRKKFGQPTKGNHELKMLKLDENHLKTNVEEGFSHFFY